MAVARIARESCSKGGTALNMLRYMSDTGGSNVFFSRGDSRRRRWLVDASRHELVPNMQLTWKLGLGRCTIIMQISVNSTAFVYPRGRHD